MILQPNERAPEFELPQWTGLRDREGRHWNLGGMLSKGPAFLVFAKATCPTCSFAVPFIDRIFRSYPNMPASVVLIAQEDSVGGARMATEWGLKMPVLLDSSPYPVSESYGLSFVPGGFFVNQEGVIENSFESFEREEIREINRKLAKRAGAPPADIFPAEEGVPPFRPG